MMSWWRSIGVIIVLFVPKVFGASDLIGGMQDDVSLELASKFGEVYYQSGFIDDCQTYHPISRSLSHNPIISIYEPPRQVGNDAQLVRVDTYPGQEGVMRYYVMVRESVVVLEGTEDKLTCVDGDAPCSVLNGMKKMLDDIAKSFSELSIH